MRQSRIDAQGKLKMKQGFINKNIRGFTLIELLVVVLIIGVLAAAALPQYQTAVAKSRMSALLPFMRSVQQAAQRYYMANGSWPSSMNDLDVTCASFGSGSHEGWCYLDNKGHSKVHIDEGSYIVAQDGRVNADVLLLFWFNGGAGCYAYENNNFELGKKICFGLTGDEKPGGLAGWATVYRFAYKS